MRKIAWFGSVAVLATALSGDATATVTQLDMTTLPQPTPPAEISVVTSRGFLATDDTLAGLFAIRGETLDPSKDAHQTPGTFSPQCGFTGKIVLHGGGCKNALGWYNVTSGSTTPPPATQIYVLVPADLTQAPPMGISCKDGDFCPMAEPNMSTTQVGQHTWVDYTWNASSIAMDARYKGGQVGFALIGNGGQCSQTKYSQAELNVVATKYNMPWVTTLIYQSTVDPSSYYIAFEDEPMSPADWKQGGCDGDFNDFVFYVTGLNCQGGGIDCDTMLPGVCAGGTTQCSSGGETVKCVPNIKPSDEKCNGLDDDCDGTVDNADAPGLCDKGYVCSQGKCIPPCNDSEFPCSPPSVCDKTDQLCKDPACIGVTCGAEQTCYEGTCIGGCKDVVCPVGRSAGSASASTRAGASLVPRPRFATTVRACRPARAVPALPVRRAPVKATCVDTGCDKVTCKAPQLCVAGKCQDGCQGVKCPTGQECTNGACTTPDSGPIVPHPDAGSSTGGTIGSGGRIGSGTGGQVGSGGSSGLGGSALGGNSGTGGSNGGSCRRDPDLLLRREAEPPGPGGSRYCWRHWRSPAGAARRGRARR